MNRINMTKYGFERWPEKDFSDDGSRFTCYRAGDIEVSKTTWNGEVFLSGHGDSRTVPYEIYSKLPHYRDLDKLNGVPISSLVDDDLFELYNACLEYSKELKEAEANLVFPTIAELKDQCLKIRAHYQEQVDKLDKMFAESGKDLLLNASEYDIKNLRSYYKTLKNRATLGYDPNVYPQSIYGTAYSFSFIKSNYDLNDTWYFNEITKIIKNVA